MTHLQNPILLALLALVFTPALRAADAPPPPVTLAVLPSDAVAGKTALENAALNLIERVLPQLVVR